jgi:hypothetical protein
LYRLGATPGCVFWLVMKHGGILAVIGIVAGLFTVSGLEIGLGPVAGRRPHGHQFVISRPFPSSVSATALLVDFSLCR